MHACTISPRHRLAHVRVLAESFRELHPAARFSVLVLDGEPAEPDDENAPYTALTPGEIGVGTEELRRLALIHDAGELGTVMIPVLAAHLLDGAAGEPVVYLDCDSLVLGDLTDVAAVLRPHGIVLLPSVFRPRLGASLRQDSLNDQLLRLDDIGFLAVDERARPFLSWWHARMLAEHDLDPMAPIEAVQRWYDLLPGPFEHALWSDDGIGVAYWNLADRPLSRDAGGSYRAGDAALRWMRFNGYDLDKPYLLSPLQGPSPRSRLSLDPALAEITDTYRDRLLKAGAERWQAVPYRFGVVGGGPLPLFVRRLAANALSQHNMLEPPPLPFTADGDAAFIRWLNQPWAWRGDRTVTLFVLNVWAQRPDVQAAFPDPVNADTDGLAHWADSAPDFVAEHGHLHDPPREPLSEPAADPEPLPGMNIIGYLRGELGLGEAGRRMALAADAAGLPYETASYGFVPARQLDPFAAAHVAEASAPYRVNLMCVNAGSLVHLVANMPPRLRRGRHRVGLWFWETNRPEPTTEHSLELVDEVWVTSDYLAEVLRPHTDKPVLVAPLAVPPPAPTRLVRRDLGIPEDRQLFLCSFDVFSSTGRKNPIGTLHAYMRAFGPDDGAHLIMKSINGARRPELLEQMWYLARHRPDIEIRDGYVSRSEMNGLIQLSDVYVSLHRSEGFGLNLAAAMAAGRPVIATNYSGNLAFMNEANSRLVPYTMTEVGPGNPPYPPHDRWAEPDLDAAAGHMVELLDRDASRRLGERARADIARTHGPDVAGAWLARELHRILDWSPARAGRTGGPRP